MKIYDLIVLGFGKAGKTLAAHYAKSGKKVALIEKQSSMFGGTCINVGCIPTKTFIYAVEHNLTFDDAFTLKNTVVERLNNKNYSMLKDIVDIYVGNGKFIDDKVIEIKSEHDTIHLTAEIIVINTGAVSRVPKIDGIDTAKNVVDSSELLTLKKQPQRLGIIGGGNIGLEFACGFANAGSSVTIFDPSDRLLAKYDQEVAPYAVQYIEELGINIQLSTTISSITNQNDNVVIHTNNGNFEFDTVLYATGRIPNTKDLGLENTTIMLNENGSIKVDKHCQTSVTNVFAVGDVNGGPQFTYVSLDDFRIVWNYLNNKHNYTLDKRTHIPSTLFIQPPLSQVGLNEEQAKSLQLNYSKKVLPVSGMPRAHVNNDLRGICKVIVDNDSKLILGASLLCKNSEEIINLITMAMDNNIPYTYLANQIFTHPTMSENLNDLFNI